MVKSLILILFVLSCGFNDTSPDLINCELEDSIMELSYIIAAECMECDSLERSYVGAVVLNRQASGKYPETIKAVIEQENQFHGLCNEQYVYVAKCYEIAKKLVYGAERNEEIIFFWRKNQKTPKYVTKVLLKSKYHNFGR